MDLESLPAIDHHAHNVVRSEVADAGPFVRAFSEAHDGVAIAHARQTMFFRRSLRDLGLLLDCEPVEERIVERRKELGLEELTRRSFAGARLERLLLDDGFMAGDILPLDWHARHVPVQRVLRIETLAEDLLRTCDRFDDFEDRFRAHLEGVGPEVAAYKSIACYRTGLDVQVVAREEARAHFLTVRRRTTDRIRLDDKMLVDYLLAATLQIAARKALPVQLHTGFGDPDLDLRLANPLHLRQVLENPRYRGAVLVLLHASYPFAREAGYLASVYPQVYLDTGLAVAFLSVAGMRNTMGELIELAPWSKLMYSSDAHLIPELYFLAAKWGRRVLGQVLEGAMADGDLTAAEAEQAARAILAGNAREVYRSKGDRA